MTNIINEDFSNVFDSSLVDYSDDMKKSDISYKEKIVYDWLEKHFDHRILKELNDGDIKETVNKCFDVKIENGIPYLYCLDYLKNKYGLTEIVFGFNEEDSDIEVPFIIKDDANVSKFNIYLHTIGNHIFKKRLKDLRFIGDIKPDKLKFNTYNVYADNLSWVPSAWKIESYDNEKFIVNEYLNVWKNTDFIFGEKEHRGDKYEIYYGHDYESKKYGLIDLYILSTKSAPPTYESLFKNILENINSSVINNEDFIHIRLNGNTNDHMTFKSGVNLFKIDSKKVLIAYSKHEDSWRVGGTWDGYNHYENIEMPFILENGELKFVKIDRENNKILSDAEINPVKKLLGESFENIFDSSLVDYSDDFKESDRLYNIKTKAKQWLGIYINPEDYGIWLDEYDQQKLEDDFWNNWVIINSDGTITLHLNVHLNCNFNIDPTTIARVIDYQNKDDNNRFDIPYYIKFKEVWNGFSCCYISDESMDKLEEWFPKKLVRPCDSDYYRIWDDRDKNLLLEHLDFFKKLSIDNKKNIEICFNLGLETEKVIHIYYDGTDDLNINESFENVFDSSLIDYSSDFIIKDKEYLEENPIHYPEIYNWLKSVDLIGPDFDNRPRKYWINENGTIDASGCIDIDLHNNVSIPKFIQFNEIWGSFHISFNDDLQKSKFNPRWRVDGPLAFGPKIVHGDYWVSYCNNLQTLKGCPEIIDGDFICMHNSDLCTFKYFPKKVGGKFTYYGNALSLYCKDYSGSRGTPLPGEPEKGPLYGAGWTEEKVRNIFDIGGEIDGGIFAKEKE